jgi:hypothetical protein
MEPEPAALEANPNPEVQIGSLTLLLPKFMPL